MAMVLGSWLENCLTETETALEEGKVPTIFFKEDMKTWATRVVQQPIPRKLMMLLSFGLVIAFSAIVLFTLDSPTSESKLTEARLKGFTNNYWTSSLVLCPSNMEYRIADVLVGPLFETGFTPNGIVFLNCVIRVVLLLFYNSYYYNMVVVLLAVIQVLDAADGQLARAHGMASEFGAALDHGTDNAFSAVFVCFTMYLLILKNGARSKAVLVLGSMFLLIALMGYNYEKAIERSLDYKDCNVFAVVGMYQALHMLYIQWILTLVACHLTDWMPHRNLD